MAVWAIASGASLDGTTSLDDSSLDADKFASTRGAISITQSLLKGGGNSANLIDGIHTSNANYGYTVWTSSPPQSMTLDLKAATDVSRVRVLNYDWGYRFHRYKIESSLNNTTWSNLVDASGGTHMGWEDWAVSRPARYLKFTGLSNSANQMVAVAEWEVYGTRPPLHAPPAAPPSSGMVSARLAGAGTLPFSAGATVGSSSGGAVTPRPALVVTSDDGPEHTNGWAAVDGDPHTAWIGRPGTDGWYITLAYGSALTMTNLAVDLAAGSLTNYQSLFSLDATNWARLPLDLQAHPVQLNYLWLIFPKSTTEAVPQVIEIRP